MKIERLKKSHKKEIIIGGMIILGIISAITITTSRAKYRLTQSIPIVRGTINYKPYDFKIMAMYKQKDGSTCTQDSCYDEITGEMPESGYVVNEDKSYCLTSNNEEVKGKVKTINGKHYITGLKKNDKCYVWFDKEALSPATTLAKLNITNYNVVAPTFSNVATTNEGIYRVADGMYNGYSYYWRGAVTNNHVIFANMCWRIVRINGDGTIRLIYNGTMNTSNACLGNDNIAIPNIYYNVNTNSSKNPERVGWTYTEGKQRPTNNATATPSNAKTETEKWFTQYITGTNLSKVADGKFCNDRSLASGVTWSSPSNSMRYAVADRLAINSESVPSPTLSCPEGDTYTLKTGALTGDEMVYAGFVFGGSGSTNNFLGTGSARYWSMTPVHHSNAPYVAVVSDWQLKIANATDTTAIYGIRPVLNLNANISFQNGGLGTSNKPYVVID